MCPKKGKATFLGKATTARIQKQYSMMI